MQPANNEAAPAARRWYGWQTLGIDFAAVSLMIAGLGSSTTKGDAGQLMAYGGFGAYLIGGPITHFAHGSTTRGLGSFAIRAAAPAGFAVMGAQLDVCGRQEEICTLGGAAVGMAVAVAVDAALLGYEALPVSRPGLARLGISVDREHMAIVAGGTF